MHADVKVIKEALQQLRKANSWVQPALELEEMDAEVLSEWEDAYSSVIRALRDALGEAE